MGTFIIYKAGLIYAHIASQRKENFKREKENNKYNNNDSPA